MAGIAADLILVALIITFAVNGYRQGFLVGGLSFVGFFGGALGGLQLAPLAAGRLDSPVARVVISLAMVFGLAIAGHSIAAWAGTRLRRAIRNNSGRRLDDLGGVVVSVTAFLLVAWMVAGPLGVSPIPSVSRSVRNSAILHAVDSVMPDQARVLYNGLRDAIAQGDFPNVFGDLTPTRAREVSPPDPALLSAPGVQLARASTVKVTGTAPSCRRRIEGSGFVFASQKVMTNAHVVAGTEGDLQIEVGQEQRTGWVVYFDPALDIAVVHVPKLRAPPLEWATSAANFGDDAIVLGYPQNGPFRPTAARVRDVRDVRGPDIYNETTVRREVYTLRAEVISGNSGGPLIDVSGNVLGVVFAAALDDPDVGFAVTADEVAPAADAGRSRTNRVSTGPCI